jgi:hypothetical protein
MAEWNARRFGPKDPSSGAPTYPRNRPIHATFGPPGTASNESAEFDATAEWLAHVEAGKIGGA